MAEEKERKTLEESHQMSDLDRLRQNMKEQRTENLHTTEKIIQQTSRVHDRNSPEGCLHKEEDILQLKTMLAKSKADLKEKKALIIQLKEECEISRSLIDKLTLGGQVFLEKIQAAFINFHCFSDHLVFLGL